MLFFNLIHLVTTKKKNTIYISSMIYFRFKGMFLFGPETIEKFFYFEGSQISPCKHWHNIWT